MNQLSARTRVAIGVVALVIGATFGWLTTDRSDRPGEPGPSPSPSPSGSPAGADLEERWWGLARGRVGTEALRPAPGYAITLNVGAQRLGGIGGCNSYGGRVSVAGDDIRFGSIGARGASCGDEIDAIEARYLRALREAQTIDVGEDTLVLEGADATLVFEPLPPVPLDEIADTRWHLQSLLIRKGERLVTREVDAATLQLRSNGVLEAQTGCGVISGAFQARGPYIVANDTDLDGRCPRSEADQEQHLIAMMRQFTATTEAGTLTLFGTGGAGPLGAIYSKT